MATVETILWRQVTDSDFVCVERSRENTPSSGGGQTYFSLGTHLSGEGLGRFLGLDPPSLITSEHDPVEIEAAVLGEPSTTEMIEFRPRYQDGSDGRYCIARQNRQRKSQVRHPAWTKERGFPVAPDDIADKTDPRMPDLSFLKLIIARCDDGVYTAGYVNGAQLPDGAPGELAILFEPNSSAGSDGLIALKSGTLSLDHLSEVIDRSRERLQDGGLASPEIEDARDATARSAGARSRRGQGFRQSAEERAAIDRHAMERAKAELEGEGWKVYDRSIDHPYDLECKRKGEQLHVEVKGTTSCGAVVLLTPNEVAFARSAFPAMALLILHDIQLVRDEDGKVTAGGGEIELIVPWNIDEAGILRPTGFGYELI